MKIRNYMGILMKSESYIRLFSRELCEFSRNEYNGNNVKVGGIIFA
jgi:hypothetical protein